MSTPTIEIAVTTQKTNVRRLTTMAMLVAIGAVAVALVEVPIFPAAPFLKYDPGNIPILIGTLMYGPVAGLILTFVGGFIQSFMLHGSSGLVGFFMHVVAGSAMVLFCGLVYKMKILSTQALRLRMAVALAAGSAAMVAVMVAMNLVVTPLFMGTPVEVVKSMMVPVIIPFNLIKAGINAVFVFLIYPYVEKLVVK